MIRALGKRAVLGRVAGRRLPHERLQRGADLRQLIAAEPRAGSAAINQSPILVCADVQRTEAAAGAFRLRETHDDEIVDAVGADLQPVG